MLNFPFQRKYPKSFMRDTPGEVVSFVLNLLNRKSVHYMFMSKPLGLHWGNKSHILTYKLSRNWTFDKAFT